ncbi:MAG TPA: DUF5615 family PIN-like protein [Oculatellaceae cyanobacterium]
MIKDDGGVPHRHRLRDFRQYFRVTTFKERSRSLTLDLLSERPSVNASVCLNKWSAIALLSRRSRAELFAVWLQSTFNVHVHALRDLGMRDANDIAIFDAARAANAVAMTKDIDFVKLCHHKLVEECSC